MERRKRSLMGLWFIGLILVIEIQGAHGLGVCLPKATKKWLQGIQKLGRSAFALYGDPEDRPGMFLISSAAYGSIGYSRPNWAAWSRRNSEWRFLAWGLCG